MFEGDLRWGVKQSFVRYVQVTGEIGVLAPARREAEGFTFPLEKRLVTRIQYSGGVTFDAHRGLLSLTLKDPWIEFGDNGATGLSVLHVSNLQPEGERVVIAHVAYDGATVLCESGVSLFDAEYAAGTELDALTFAETESASIGASA